MTITPENFPRDIKPIEKATTGPGPNGHTHSFEPGQAWTGPPIGDPDEGDEHVHRIVPGRTQTEPADVDNHTHSM